MLCFITFILIKSIQYAFHSQQKEDIFMRTICIRVDDETKKQFQEFCDSAGISLSAAITIFLKSVIRENKLPFEIKGTRSI